MTGFLGVCLVCLLTCFFASTRVLGDLLYVGTEAPNLYTLNFDENTGKIGLNTTLTLVPNPSFLVLHPSGDYIYAVSEVESFNGVNNTGGIAAYKINKSTGHLSLINTVVSKGTFPAYIGLDGSSRWLGVANYGSGNYGVWKILSDFSISEAPTSFFQDHGKGPMPQQEGPHAHEFVFNPTNTFAVIPDLGIDRWMQFNFDEKTGQLSPFVQPSIESPPGSGPRHLTYHPTLPYAYGVCEISSTVTVFLIDKTSPALKPVQSITTLPSNKPSEQSAAAEVKISPEGTILYASNRPAGVNGTIATFKIDQTSGFLTNIGYAPTLGIYPRYFTLSKNGAFVLVANQVSNNIVVFKRNTISGLLGPVVSFVENIIQASFILQI